MNTNETPQVGIFSFSTVMQLHLELQKEKDFTGQLEKRLLNAEEEIKGLCAIAEDAANMDEIISHLVSQVEALSSQIAVLSQPISITPD